MREDLEEFLISLRQKQYSEITLQKYKSYLNHFLLHLEKRGIKNYHQVSSKILTNYIQIVKQNIITDNITWLSKNL